MGSPTPSDNILAPIASERWVNRSHRRSTDPRRQADRGRNRRNEPIRHQEASAAPSRLDVAFAVDHVTAATIALSAGSSSASKPPASGHMWKHQGRLKPLEASPPVGRDQGQVTKRRPPTAIPAADSRNCLEEVSSKDQVYSVMAVFQSVRASSTAKRFPQVRQRKRVHDIASVSSHPRRA